MAQVTLFGREAEETAQKKNPEKVEIVITPDCGPFCESVEKYGGQYFTDVSYSGKIYGGGSPCMGEDQINGSIESAKKTILHHGDIPVVKYLRELVKLGGE